MMMLLQRVRWYLTKIFQEIIDIIRLKRLRKNICAKIRNYLNMHPIALRYLLNYLSLFKQSSAKKSVLLRFCGANIGENCYIGDDVFILTPQNLTVEDYCGIGDNSILQCWNEIAIRKYSFCAANCLFVSGSHNTMDYTNLENQNIEIGRGCWIGTNSTIMGGCRVMNGCIIGAGTVLRSGEYPAFSIIAGVPGKIIKQRLCAEVIEQPVRYSIEELL